MKAVILAGGYGTRISEESAVRPKPMVGIGEQPIIWHIMKTYAHHGITDFIIACGYKGHMIKDYFSGMYLSSADVTFDLANNTMEFHHSRIEPWRVTCVDTGMNTMTGGRLLRIREHLEGETFCMTYGDGVANIDITREIEFHRQSGKLATMAAVMAPGRFGAFTLNHDETAVTHFQEKPHGDGAWINGGYFVLEPEVLDYIGSDADVWEKRPLQKLAHQGHLQAFRHEDFWHPMDTLRDKHVLEELWETKEAPWKVWEDKR